MFNPFAFFLEFSVLGQVVFLLVFVLVAYFGFLRAGLSLAPWVPTHKKDLERVNRLCNLQPGDVFIEAGCGNAVVTSYIARMNPEVRCIGVEYSTIMFIWAKCKTALKRVPNLEIVYGDALLYDFRKADVVYTYGLTHTVNQKLLPKVQREMKPGSRFISYAFAIKASAVQIDESDTSSNLYVYSVSK